MGFYLQERNAHFRQRNFDYAYKGLVVIRGGDCTRVDYSFTSERMRDRFLDRIRAIYAKRGKVCRIVPWSKVRRWQRTTDNEVRPMSGEKLWW